MSSYLIELNEGVFLSEVQFNTVNQMAFKQKTVNHATNWSKERAADVLDDIKKEFPNAKVWSREKALKKFLPKN